MKQLCTLYCYPTNLKGVLIQYFAILIKSGPVCWRYTLSCDYAPKFEKVVCYSGVPWGGWGFNPPKFRSFNKAEPYCKL